MKTTFRWYGEGNDTVTLEQIRQIPSMTGVVWALHDLPAGEVWPEARIAAVKAQAAKYDLNIDVVESVNVHEAIKLGTPEREQYIENYKESLRNLGKHGVKVVCYNFMPVFDWMRTDLFHASSNGDGSTALFYDASAMEGLDPKALVKSVEEGSNGLTLPGWEPERLAHLDKLFDAYKTVSEDDLRRNLKYFLEAIIPTAEQAGIKMGIHPDDPPFSIFGLPRIVKNYADLKAILEMVDSPANGLTLCSGALGPNPDNDIVQMIHDFHERIPFAHIRNIKRFANGDFVETSHLSSDGSLDIAAIVLASVIESLTMRDDFARLRDIAAAPSLQLVSLTITEKGYAIKDRDGAYYPAVAADFKDGIARPQSYIGNIVALLHARWQAGGAPLALVSMDNMSHNGEKLRAVIMEFARAWQSAGHVAPEFVAWLESDQVAFPWTMIDKITPRPDPGIAERLRADGLDNIDAVITSKNTYVAPYVNAEELEYLVIEDTFPNGRPPLEQAGVLFADRDTVNKVETMKVTTCLNPIHTALAIYGCLLGYTSIHAEMQDAELLALARAVGYREGLPVVANPGILDPQTFIDEVVNVRLPNPYIPDTPQRIATDTSQKLAIRFGHTIKAHGANAAALTAIPLVLAGWCRYLLGVDDNGNAFTCSPDPLLESAQAKLQDVRVGSDNLGNVRELLADSAIFGVDLYVVGLGEKIEDYLREMLKGNGAVRATLRKHLT